MRLKFAFGALLFVGACGIVTIFGVPMAASILVNKPQVDLCSKVKTSPHEVAISPDGSIAYVSDYVAGRVLVISTAADTIIASIPVPRPVDGVVFSPDGVRAYAVTANRGGPISAIDSRTNSVVLTIPLGDVRPTSIAISKNGKKIFVIGRAPNQMVAVDTATGAVLATVTISGDISFAAISPDDSKIYVSGDNLSVIDSETYSILKTIPLDRFADGVAVSADGSKLALASWGDTNIGVFGGPGSVKLMDARSGNITDTITVGSSPKGIVFSPDNARVFVSNNMANPGTISIVDLGQRAVTATVAVGSFPGRLAVTPNGKKIYVPSSDGPPPTISVIDLGKNLVSSKIAVPMPPLLLPEPGKSKSDVDGCRS